MSSTLAVQLGEVFEHAGDQNRFFSARDLDVIRTKHEVRETPSGIPRRLCETNLFFGFFFDGTKNNYMQAAPTKSQSNVARLYDCFPGLSVPGVLPKTTEWKRNPEQYSHFFRVYIPGVSSEFQQVGDSGTGTDATLGAAGGAYGERRIIWALVQAVNNLHRYFYKAPLVSPDEALALARTVILNKDSRKLMVGGLNEDASKANKIARQKFEELLRRLHSAMKPHWPDKKTGKPAKIDPGIVKTIYISMFGFSRGATQARAYANWLRSLCLLDAQLTGASGHMSLGGFPVKFDFLGLFDTVASVGISGTLGFADGHGAWADTEESLRVPTGLRCLHLVAAHEIRRSFPLDSISVQGIVPPGCQEIVVPGVHSDVGCGYCPREQGRGTDPNGDDMLARIPLLVMYKHARSAGVPLKLELTPPEVQAKFALTAAAIKSFNAYIAECKETSGPLYKIMREQARKYIEWRVARRTSGKTPMHTSASFGRAVAFDQNDLHSAMLEFEQEIQEFETWLNEKGKSFVPSSQQAGFDDEHMAEWEQIATWWRSKSTPSPAVMDLFDNYVHDSRAWFKLDPRSPDNEPDMHKLLAKWVKQRRWAQERNSIKVQAVDRGNSRMSMPVHDGLSDEQRKAADEYARTGAIPRLITSGREPQTFAGAGYLRYRKVYAGFDDELISAAPKGETDNAPESLISSPSQAAA